MVRRLLLLVTILNALACSEGPSARDSHEADARVDIRPPWPFPDGNRDLLPSDTVAAGSDRCTGAVSIPLSGGSASVSGTTAGATNEFGTAIRCGETTSLVGPQRYYKLVLASGKTYELTLKPTFAAVLYLFSECSKNIINADCSSGGATGEFSGTVPAGSMKRVRFTASAGGTYYLAVDSAEASGAGSFDLTVTEAGTPTNATCNKAAALTLSSGKATVQGTTVGAANELVKQVTCNLGVTFDGPQVYYTIALTAGSWYRLSLAPAFAASLYVASQAAGCKATNINTDCGGITGTVLLRVPSGTTASTAFSPLQSGSYVVAVDSLDPTSAGTFTLTIEAFTPAGNMICSAAQALTLSGGKAVVAGDTSSGLNDRGAQVVCGSGSPLLGPQAYFKVPLEKKAYQLALTPTFAATLAVGASCITLPADCGSGGLSGAALKVAAGATGLLSFTPASAGTHVVAVDSTQASANGSFQLVVQEHSPATNGSCSQPRALVLSSSPVLELGDTGSLSNDLSSVDCGHLKGPWPGPQAYYQVSLAAGKTYSIELTPEAGFDPALYAFPAATSCTSAAVNTACQGLASDTVGAGLKESLSLSPPASAAYILVVDSWSLSEVGSYTLAISWK